jgi:hypothetical protein
VTVRTALDADVAANVLATRADARSVLATPAAAAGAVGDAAGAAPALTGRTLACPLPANLAGRALPISAADVIRDTRAGAFVATIRAGTDPVVADLIRPADIAAGAAALIATELLARAVPVAIQRAARADTGALQADLVARAEIPLVDLAVEVIVASVADLGLGADSPATRAGAAVAGVPTATAVARVGLGVDAAVAAGGRSGGADANALRAVLVLAARAAGDLLPAVVLGRTAFQFAAGLRAALRVADAAPVATAPALLAGLIATATMGGFGRGVDAPAGADDVPPTAVRHAAPAAAGLPLGTDATVDFVAAVVLRRSTGDPAACDRGRLGNTGDAIAGGANLARAAGASTDTAVARIDSQIDAATGAFALPGLAAALAALAPGAGATLFLLAARLADGRAAGDRFGHPRPRQYPGQRRPSENAEGAPARNRSNAYGNLVEAPTVHVRCLRARASTPSQPLSSPGVAHGWRRA